MTKIEALAIDLEVRGYDCGYGGPLRVLPLANFLQEAAGAHAYSLGFGIDNLKAAGQTWMLAKLDLRVDRLPHEGETLRVRTWPSGLDRLLALRDIVLETRGGEVLVRSVYAYLVVDLAARRPLRPERALARLADLDVSDLGHSVPYFRFGVEEPGEGARGARFLETANARHLDDNGHVNNAHLLDWLVDAVPRHARGSGLLSELRVDFLREAFEGDRLELGAASGETGRCLALSDIRRGDEILARAETLWLP